MSYELYLPGVHASQLLELDALAWYPRGQFLHFASPSPVGGENDPGAHSLQFALDERPKTSEYEPSSHRLQTEADVAPRVSL